MALFRLTDDQVKTAVQILSNVSIPVNYISFGGEWIKWEKSIY